MHGFLPSWEFRRGGIFTPIELAAFETTADGKMRLRKRR